MQIKGIRATGDSFKNIRPWRALEFANATIENDLDEPDVGVITLANSLLPYGIISVKSAPFNAEGDGTTDDTVAIHAARDAAGVGGQLYFPQGTYLVDGLIASVANQKWSLHPGATIKLADDSTSGYLLNVTGEDVTVEGGTWDQNFEAQSGPGDFFRSMAEGTTFRYLHVTNFSAHGIWGNKSRFTVEGCRLDHGLVAIWVSSILEDLYDIQILNNRIDLTNADPTPYPNPSGITVYAGASGFTARRIIVANNRIALPLEQPNGACGGVGMITCEEFTVSGNVIRGGNIAISCSGASKGIVIGNTVREPDLYGIELAISDHITVTGNMVDGANLCFDGIVETALGSNNNIISSNTVVRCEQDAISINGVSSGIIGNSVNVPTSGRHGIAVRSTADDSLVSANIITTVSDSGSGIMAEGCEGISITGNTLTGGGVCVYAIDVQSPTGAISVTGNVAKEFDTIGLRFSATTAITLDEIVAVGNLFVDCGTTIDWVLSGGASIGTRVIIGPNNDGRIEFGNNVGSLALSGGLLRTFSLTIDDVLKVGTGITLAEQPAPPPATNAAILYAMDNGSGKTKLMVRFPSGADVELGIDP